jgi:hypothetical protein
MQTLSPTTHSLFTRICRYITKPVLALTLSLAITPAFGEVTGISSIEKLTIANNNVVTVEIEEDFLQCAGQGNAISFTYDEATNSVNYLTALSTAYHSGMLVAIEYDFDNSVCSMQSVTVFYM